jgi:hypothetical protein
MFPEKKVSINNGGHDASFVRWVWSFQLFQVGRRALADGRAGAHGCRVGAAVEAEVSFSEQGAARQPLLLDSHRWQGIFQNDYTAFAIGMTDSIAAAMLPELPYTACQSGHLAITSRSNKGSLESRISSFK